MDHISRAWGVVSRDLVAWIVLVLVAGCAIVLTCGLGTLLVGPNLVLATKRAIDRGVAPEIGDLFQTDLIVEYVVYWIILIVLSVVGGWVPLIIDRRFGAIDAIQASFHHAKGAFFDLLVFTIILYVIAFLGTCACVVGLFVAVPVSMVATWLYYQAERQNILAAAINAGLKPLP